MSQVINPVAPATSLFHNGSRYNLTPVSKEEFYSAIHADPRCVNMGKHTGSYGVGDGYVSIWRTSTGAPAGRSYKGEYKDGQRVTMYQLAKLAA